MLKPAASPLHAEADWPSQDDRRASQRHRVNLQVRCHPLAEAAPTAQVQVRDLSTLGIGLVLPFPVEMRSLVEIELQNARGLLVRHALGRVVHVEEASGRSWLVGCAFVSELSPSEMSIFNVEAVRPDGGDHRRWLRFPCNVETVCYTCETAPGEQHPARVLNISPGGIGLLLSCEFSQGTLLNMELPAAPNQPARPILVRVVRAIEHGKGYWFLGCEFADQLDAEELRMLLR